MKTLNNILSEQLKDEEFRKEYEAIQPEMDVIRAIEAAENAVIVQNSPNVRQGEQPSTKKPDKGSRQHLSKP